MRPAASALSAWRTPLLAAFSLMAIGGVISGSQSSRALAGSAPTSVTQEAGQALSPSTPEQMALVEHLRLKGAVFYGAWWCPHCLHQKALFGTEASQRLPYVECEKDEAGKRRCAAALIQVFPTWDLNGERREGMLSLEELMLWSGFRPSGAKPPAVPAGSGLGR